MRYFYRIKAPSLNNKSFDQEWQYKPLYLGYIEAEDKNQAREKLEKELSLTLSFRSLKKDIGVKNFFLLQLYPATDYFDKVWLKEQECSQCGNNFSKLERDQAFDGMYIRSGFCSLKCEGDHKVETNTSFDQGYHQALIYKITNKNTGKCYIGKTTQAFTLRWYQHFYQSTDTKFHQEIKKEPLTSWSFEILETFNFNGSDIDQDDSQGYGKILTDREKHYIEKFDSIKNGYNTAN